MAGGEIRPATRRPPADARVFWRRRLTAAAVIVLAFAAALAGAVASSRQAATANPPALFSGGQIVRIDCPAPSLGGTLPVAVFLPPSYLPRTHRYPVVYFLHGLPAGRTLYEASGFVEAAAIAGHYQAIVVAPQGARSDGDDREYLNWGPKENWPQAIARDLPACVDARFATIANRDGRALIGLSAGAFGAFNIGLRSLGTFAAVESWSGYFAATDPSGLHDLRFSSAAAQAGAQIASGTALLAALRQHPAFLGFYVGNQDTRFLEDNVALHQALTREGIAHWYAVYPGGHTQSLWAAWAPRWVGHALAYLAYARARTGTGR